MQNPFKSPSVLFFLLVLLLLATACAPNASAAPVAPSQPASSAPADASANLAFVPAATEAPVLTMKIVADQELAEPSAPAGTSFVGYAFVDSDNVLTFQATDPSIFTGSVTGEWPKANVSVQLCNGNKTDADGGCHDLVALTNVGLSTESSQAFSLYAPQ
jgi:hypothetical protein